MISVDYMLQEVERSLRLALYVRLSAISSVEDGPAGLISQPRDLDGRSRLQIYDRYCFSLPDSTDFPCWNVTDLRIRSGASLITCRLCLRNRASAFRVLAMTGVLGLAENTPCQRISTPCRGPRDSGIGLLTRFIARC